MSAPEPTLCGNHAEAIAGWRCQGECRKHLCGQCTAKLVNRFICCECGASASRLTAPRKSKSFVHWLAVAIAYPVWKGLPLFALLAILLGAIPYMTTQVESQAQQLAGISMGARAALIFLYMVVVVDMTARGGSERGAGIRIARAIGATTAVWGPAVAYILLVGVPGKAASHDGVLWMYGALAFIYLPLALAVAVTDTPFADVANPFKIFDLMWQLRWTYVATLLSVGALAAVAVAAATGAAANLKASVDVPLVSDVVGAIPSLWVFGALAGAIGSLTRVHGDLIGWGLPGEYEDPIYPKMVAEGRRKVAQPTPGAVADEAAVDPAERAEAAKLADALRAEDLGRALRMYEARATWSAASLDDRKLLVLARAATRARKLELAERLLDEAFARNGRSASQALLALAQLNADVLAKPDKANEIYRKLVEQFPGSDPAKIAAKKLSA